MAAPNSQTFVRLNASAQLRHSASELWPLLSATDKLNREWGLPAITYNPVANARGGSDLKANTLFMGRKIEWDEEPYEWVEPAVWRVKRVYKNGPIKAGTFSLNLEPGPGIYTTATFACEYLPSSFATAWLVRYSLDNWCRKAALTAKSADDFLDRKTPSACMKRFKQAAIDRDALESSAARVRQTGVPDALLAKLISDIECLPEEDVVRMRPFEVAARWGEGRNEVLLLFMRSVRAGLLDLFWQAICPHCRGAANAVKSLKQIHNKARCEFCNLNFETEFDRSIEARFTVNTAIRQTEDRVYCAGGPGRTRHIHTQMRLQPGATRGFSLELPTGSFRIRAVQFPSEFTISVSRDQPSVPPCLLRVDDNGFSIGSFITPPGKAMFEIESKASAYIDLKLESREWEDNAATGVIVTSIPEFYDLASRDVLQHDEELAVKSVALLFSDLRGSTALYRQLGDAQAYALVRQHFKVMEKEILRNHGGIVKTIGDAVMAVFTSAPQAARCCFDIQKAFVDLWKHRPETMTIVVKLGFHCGPCLAVNLNDRIDYFGTTVNIAARVQNESHGGDIVMLNSVFKEQGIQEILRKHTVSVEHYNTVLKGIGVGTELVRIVPDWGGKTLPTDTAFMKK